MSDDIESIFDAVKRWSDVDDVITIMAKASFVQTPWNNAAEWSKQQAKRKAVLALQALNDAGFRLIRESGVAEKEPK